MKLDKGNPRKNMVTIKSCTLQKYRTYRREGTKTHGTKPHYEGLENPYSKYSHSKKDTQF